MDQFHQEYVPCRIRIITYSSRLLIHHRVCDLDPTLGPRIPGWNRYNPTDTTSLAILGIISTGAQPGNHQEIDSVCEYWNTILPIYPQVSISCYPWKDRI